MSALIELHNLTVQRGKRIVLNVEELEIQRNEILAIVGPNGAGKSTLLLTLARILKPSGGDFLFNGKPVTNLTDNEYRRQIGLVMQDPLLFDMSVFENVSLGLRFRNKEKQIISSRVMQWLERLEIAHLSKRRAGELSGGEAQRVSLARALVLSPEMLLLDEPFSSLDPPTRTRLLADLKSLLRETGTTTVFVTHDLNEIANLTSRTALIKDFKLHQVGELHKIKTEFE